mgnify:CR=1 FL=1
MTKEALRQAILDIISDIAPDEDVSEIDNETPLREQIELELRKRYKVQVPEEDYPQLRTLSSTIEYLMPKMPSPV